ncbi:SDR family oxidoreductase [Phaeobacter gallaeciensis]|uniref:SDR family oxidoreductase n=1 Tax=Phaeobacter gallaeciensis TaxID=60890 RepID=UPI00237F182B|nr:SDR family oxidoreductase [Phaeobacter gallaeciensis]MDE4191446.1 SDR family oxidoreductase [Phaeobacter gallaeciensis]MDE4199909.1 SDR family oxidoreductase [Phaeobacter gallaeciensis]MDE4204059.1 SDR family oxidoreductase [Phaeobacter gallaeciensis]MDE4208201.1 SDR family oxidoreductase [Phaeobacter gallaeciensis]MDE4216550.1 SDR family oxidoreductase [Phaeobacter gallaeciensis]
MCSICGFCSDHRSRQAIREASMRALVTGAGKRLGQAMALKLARQGFDVAVHYATSEAEAKATADAIRGLGRRAELVQADLLCEAEAVELLPVAAKALGGPITCLVNNASIFEHDSFETATRESWDRHFGSNLRAPFVLMQAMAAQEVEQPFDENNEPQAWGLVVNMIDQRVRRLTPEFSSYTLAKSALWTLTQTAAQGLAPRIRVNAIGPGPTLQGPRQSPQQFNDQRARTVLQRGANLGDITAALAYLLEAPAVTGQLICVDGGQHLAWETPDVVGLE